MNSEEQDIEETLSNISLSEKEKSRTTKLDIDLLEYTVISKHFGDFHLQLLSLNLHTRF